MKKLLFLMFAITLLASMTNAFAQNVILINPFKVPAGKLSESIQFWEKARDFLQTQPGYISTKLHQSLQSEATFQLINVAVWESPETFKAATQKMSEFFRTQKVKRIPGLMGHPALYKVIRE